MNDAEQIGKILNYNPTTGNLYWKIPLSSKTMVGSLAGSFQKSSGRIVIRIHGKDYKAHRLAWLLTYGKWPDDMIDHIDGNPLNNKIDNLRDVSAHINQQNRKVAQKDNRLGILGVYCDKNTGKYIAKIKVNGKSKRIGSFSSIEKAEIAYIMEKRNLHEGCTI